MNICNALEKAAQERAKEAAAAQAAAAAAAAQQHGGLWVINIVQFVQIELRYKKNGALWHVIGMNTDDSGRRVQSLQGLQSSSIGKSETFLTPFYLNTSSQTQSQQ